MGATKRTDESWRNHHCIQLVRLFIGLATLAVSPLHVVCRRREGEWREAVENTGEWRESVENTGEWRESVENTWWCSREEGGWRRTAAVGKQAHLSHVRIRHFHPVLQGDGFGRYVVVQESDRIGFGPSEERGMASPTRDRSGRFARPNHQENAKRRPHSIHLGWYSTTARMVSGGVGWCRVLGQTEVRARLTPEVRARLIRPHAQAVVAQAVGRFTNESLDNNE